MAYPSYYTPSYNMYSQMQNIPQMSPTAMTANPPQTNQGLIWVCGETGAKSYLVAPNNTVLLMDSEGNRFYLKSSDNAGMPTLKTYEYKEVIQNNIQPQSNVDYVTRDEYTALENKYNDLVNKIEELSKERKTTVKKKEGAESE